jgi:short-subunit dehydrogenase
MRKMTESQKKDSPKKILITGASRGIGEAIALHFSSQGYHTILTARTEFDLARVKKDILSRGGQADYIVCDLSTEESARTLAEKIKKDFGFIEYIVLNAGISTNSDFLSQTPANFQKELNVNYIAPLLLLKELLDEMVKKKKGKIVTISSIAGILPFPGNASYAASKAALISLCMTANLELKKYNIYIGSVLPGLTRTAMTKEYESFILPFSNPDEIAISVEEAFNTEKPIIIPGIFNNVVSSIYRYFPEPLNLLVGALSNVLIPANKK